MATWSDDYDMKSQKYVPKFGQNWENKFFFSKGITLIN